jgi:cytochrome c oxidase assembly protein subunit 20
LQPGRGKYSSPIEEQEQESPKEPPAATVGNALKSISLSDYSNFHQIPCVRTALLTGMTAGFAMGAVVFISGRPIWKSTNYAVWSFIGGSGVSYKWCKWEMLKEREGMRAAIKIMDEKKEEKKRLYEERKARVLEAREAKKAAEEAEAAQKARERSWWRLWEGKGREG